MHYFNNGAHSLLLETAEIEMRASFTSDAEKTNPFTAAVPGHDSAQIYALEPERIQYAHVAG